MRQLQRAALGKKAKDRKTTVLAFESIFIAKLNLLKKIHSEGKLY